MAKLTSIASEKINASLQKKFQQLDLDIEALKRHNAAKGNLHSGSTIKELIRICCASIDSIKDEAIVQYEWVIENSIWPTKNLHNTLKTDATNQLVDILSTSNVHLQNITSLIGNPELYQKTNYMLQDAYDRALLDITLFLDGKFSTLSGQFIKNLVSHAVGFIPKLLGIYK